MTRLQKKCLVAVTGTHLLVVVVLLCSGFIASRPEPDNAQVLTMIPANLIDKAFTSGVRGAQPPPPTPIVTPPTPTPTPPTPTPPTPQRQEVKPVEPVRPPERIQPVQPKPEVPEPKPQKHEVTPDLTKVVHKKTPDTDKSAEEAKAAAKEAKRLQDQRAKALKSVLRNLKENAPASTTVDMPGDSTQAYADYASVVKTVYTAAWNLPDDTASDDANVKVSVTISNSGRVTEAHIVEKSSDAKVDSSVQRTLDRVTQLEPFPPGTKDTERTYIINFNLKAKRQLLG